MAENKIVLISGGNAGIGYETVKALLQSDTAYHIILAGRDYTKAQRAAEDVKKEIAATQSSIEAIQLDVEDDDSITKAFETVSSKYERIDCLVNNAGAAFTAHIVDGRMTPRQAWNKTWDVNVTGSQLVTETFLPLLLKSQDGRLLFVTSGLSSFHDSANTSNPRYKVPSAGLPKPPSSISYKSAKTGLNMLMLEWSLQLKSDGIKVWSVAPGMLATNLGGNPEFLKKMGAAHPSAGGISLRKVIEGGSDEYAGKVVRNYDSPVQPW